MTWPAISAPSISMPTDVIDNSTSSKTVCGMEITRPAFTRQRHEWDLKWPAMPDTELALLRAWYKTCAGGSAIFQWSDEFGNNYSVRFVGNIKFEGVTGAHSSVSLKLREA